MLVPHRTFSSPEYRYGFNGKEKDDDVKGSGMQYDYGFRIYDPRIGKFLSVDPLFQSYPWYTPYQYAGNSPILHIDLDGEEELVWILSKEAEKLIFGTNHLQKYEDGIVEGMVGDVKNTALSLKNGYEKIKDVISLRPDRTGGATMSMFLTPKEVSDNNYKFIYDKVEQGMSMLTKEADLLEKTFKGDAKAFGELTYDVAKFSTVFLKGKAPKGSKAKTKPYHGSQNLDDFVTEHAWKRHKFDGSRLSSRSRTQYGEGIDVRRIKRETMKNPDKVVRNFDANGNHYSTTYKKTFEFNISTNKTPTRESRVIINHENITKSSQFPFYKKGATDEF